MRVVEEVSQKKLTEAWESEWVAWTLPFKLNSAKQASIGLQFISQQPSWTELNWTEALSLLCSKQTHGQAGKLIPVFALLDTFYASMLVCSKFPTQLVILPLPLSPLLRNLI